MKKSILFLAALAAILSCSKENTPSDDYTAETFSVELTASAPSIDNGNGAAPANAMTKTTLVDAQNAKLVHWSKGDAIKVLFFPGRHSNAVTGPSGVLTSYFDSASSASANFRTTSWNFGIDQSVLSSRLQEVGVAVYPSTAVATSSKGSGSYTANTTEVSFDLPSEQNAVENNIEPGLNFSYASISLSSFVNTVNTGAPTELYFNNACAMIELTMPSELPAVTSISIVSNTDVPLTGKGVANLSYYNDAIDSNSRDSVTDNIFVAGNITGGAGVTLNNPSGFKAGAKYYAVVWPGIHNEGLTITFNTPEDVGAVAIKKTPAVSFVPSVVKPYTFSKGLEFAAPVKEFNYFYADGSTGNEVNSNIVGVVIFRGNPKEQFNDPDLPGQYCNGLAISTKNVFTYWGGTSALSNVPSSVKMSSYSTAHANGGYTVKKIWNNNGFNSLPMYTNSSTVDISKYNTSGWYLPVNNEWNYILANISDINALLTAAGADTINLSSSRSSAYWLPLAYGSNAITIYTDYYGTKAAYYYDWQYNTNRNVRSIFAF